MIRLVPQILFQMAGGTMGGEPLGGVPGQPASPPAQFEGVVKIRNIKWRVTEMTNLQMET